MGRPLRAVGLRLVRRGAERLLLAALLAGCSAAQPVPAPLPVSTGAEASPVVPVAATVATGGEARSGVSIPAGWCARGQAFSTERRAYCLQTEELSWEEARRGCASGGGRLAEPSTSEEHEAIASRLKAPLAASDFWIGLARDDRGQWSWEDGAPLSFSSWAPGEPNNAGEEHCAEVYQASGLWNDLSCEAALPFLCKLTAPGPKQGGFQAFRCPNPTVKAGGSDYCYHPSPLPWEQAREACQRSGGELAAIATAAEHRALLGSFGAPLRSWRVWLGLTDQKAEGQWRWASGGAVGPAHWMGGEPNNAGGDENCGELLGDRWNDLPCGVRQASLCEAP